MLKCITFNTRNSAPQREDLSKAEGSHMLTRFVLALSDQQLATGLAVLIAGVANRCRISLYEFQVITCLAWFSSTTHLATLFVLRQYLIEHPTVRNWRVLGVAASLGLLMFSVITLVLAGPLDTTGDEAILNAGSPLQCVFMNIPGRSLDFTWILNGVLTVLLIVPAYVRRIMSLYPSKEERKGYNKETLLLLSSRSMLRFYLRRKFRGMRTSASAQRQLIELACQLKPSAEERYKLLAILDGDKGSQTMGSGSRASLYQGSFLSNFPLISFGLAYGLAQTISVRWFNAPNMTDATRRMDFGQIVALFLLALPVMAAAEIYHGNVQRLNAFSPHSDLSVEARTSASKARSMKSGLDGESLGAPVGERDRDPPGADSDTNAVVVRDEGRKTSATHTHVSAERKESESLKSRSSLDLHIQGHSVASMGTSDPREQGSTDSRRFRELEKDLDFYSKQLDSRRVRLGSLRFGFFLAQAVFAGVSLNIDNGPLQFVVLITTAISGAAKMINQVLSVVYRGNIIFDRIVDRQTNLARRRRPMHASRSYDDDANWHDQNSIVVGSPSSGRQSSSSVITQFSSSGNLATELQRELFKWRSQNSLAVGRESVELASLSTVRSHTSSRENLSGELQQHDNNSFGAVSSPANPRGDECAFDPDNDQDVFLPPERMGTEADLGIFSRRASI